jgi:hypothetical protein
MWQQIRRSWLLTGLMLAMQKDQRNVALALPCGSWSDLGGQASTAAALSEVYCMGTQDEPGNLEKDRP